MKAALGGIAANLRLEMRRAFEHDFPPPDALPSPEEIRTAVTRATTNLRPALQNAILFLGKALGTKLEARGIFDDSAARRVL